MKKILLAVSLVFLLCSTVHSSVGWLPENLESNTWFWTLNVVEVMVSMGEYKFEPDTRIYFDPIVSGFVVWYHIVSDTRIIIWTFVSPRWLYDKNYTTMWFVFPDGQQLGLQMDILLTW